MPDIYAHSVFALQLLDVMPNNIKQMIENNLTSYKWGAMGPDPFYYYSQIAPKKNAQQIRSIGTLLHTTHIECIFYDMLTTYQTSQCESIKSYILGYFSHYYLDKTAHPFIFYRSGFSDNKEQAFIYSKKHKQYEMGLDAHLLDMLHKEHFSNYRLYQDIKLDKSLDSVYKYMSCLISDTYGIHLSKASVQSAFKENYTVVKLFSKHRSFMSYVSYLLPYRYHLTIKSVLPVYQIEHDYLNMANALYKDPCTGKALSFNFLELMDIASQQFLAFLFGIECHSVEDLQVVLGSDSYETGHPHNMKMKYHNSIL